MPHSLMVNCDGVFIDGVPLSDTDEYEVLVLYAATTITMLSYVTLLVTVFACFCDVLMETCQMVQTTT